MLGTGFLSVRSYQYGIWYCRYVHLMVEAYLDVDWVGSNADKRSTTSYCTVVGGYLVSWKNKN